MYEEQKVKKKKILNSVFNYYSKEFTITIKNMICKSPHGIQLILLDLNGIDRVTKFLPRLTDLSQTSE